MTQTYGVAPSAGAEPATRAAGEDATLLRATADEEPVKDGHGGHASLVSCVGNLTNTIIGSGEFFWNFFSEERRC
jgi:hypothetical protein